MKELSLGGHGDATAEDCGDSISQETTTFMEIFYF